jgi:hypothetical protein
LSRGWPIEADCECGSAGAKREVQSPHQLHRSPPIYGD